MFPIIMKGISGATWMGKKPTESAIMLGKTASNVAVCTPKRIVDKKSIALTSGPVTACIPKKGAKTAKMEKTAKSTISLVITFLNSIDSIFIFSVI